MRIAFATHAYAPVVGGAERYSQGLAEAMVGLGHDVHILAPDRQSAEAFYEFGHARLDRPESRIGGVTVDRLDLVPPRLHRFKRNPSRGTIPDSIRESMWESYSREMASRLARLAPDITIALPHTFPNVAAVMAARHAGIKVYAPLLHEDDAAWKVEPIARLARQADWILALTRWESRRLTASYGVAADAVILAPPGIDGPRPADVAPVKDPSLYFVALGRRVRSKNLTDTARAIRDLHDSGYPVRLMIIGPEGDEAVDRDLRQFGDAVEIVGEVNATDKWSYIKGSIAVVSMSSHESFGIALLEAMTMARPVVARRSPVAEELVQDGITGYLVNDHHELVTALTRLVQQPARPTAMGSSGRRSTERFSWTTSASAVISALHTDSS